MISPTSRYLRFSITPYITIRNPRMNHFLRQTHYELMKIYSTPYETGIEVLIIKNLWYFNFEEFCLESQATPFFLDS